MPDEVKAKRPRTDAQRAGEARYKKAHVRNITLSLNDRTDADIIRVLDGMERKQAFIKFCIREWIMRNTCVD